LSRVGVLTAIALLTLHQPPIKYHTSNAARPAKSKHKPALKKQKCFKLKNNSTICENQWVP